MFLAVTTDDPTYIGLGIFFLFAGVVWLIGAVYFENIKNTVREFMAIVREMRR